MTDNLKEKFGKFYFGTRIGKKTRVKKELEILFFNNQG